jgi:hypothetical protein
MRDTDRAKIVAELRRAADLLERHGPEAERRAHDWTGALAAGDVQRTRKGGDAAKPTERKALGSPVVDDEGDLLARTVAAAVTARSLTASVMALTAASGPKR